MNIFTVTCVGPPDKNHKRLWGWYAQLYDADEATINNVTDMNEAGYYPYIVIEEVGEGILPRVYQERWYLFDKEDEKYHRIDKPEEFKQTIHWYG